MVANQIGEQVRHRGGVVPMGRVKGGTANNPSPEMLERGRQFGAWFRAAISTSGKNIATIAAEAGVKPTQLYNFRDDCLTTSGIFKKPSMEMIRLLAAATNADVNDGLRAMGYATSDLPAVPTQIAALPSDALYKLSQFVTELQESRPPLERLPDEERDLIYLYNNIVQAPTVDEARNSLREFNKKATTQFMKRKDIIGKPADFGEDEGIERISDEE